MKEVIICVCMLLAMARSSNALEKEVKDFQNAVRSGDAHTINMALASLNSAISKHEAVDASPVNRPSSERQQKRNEIITALQPIERDLISVFEGDDNTVAFNAGVILGNTSGSQAVYDALRQALAESDVSSLPPIALSSLYQIGHADSEVRMIAAERIAAYKDRNERDTAFGLLRTATDVPLPEALPVCIEMLKSDALVSTKRVAAEVLMRLGPAAAKALPELQRFLAQLRAQGGDFRDIDTLERAVRAVSAQTQTPEPAPASTGTRGPSTRGPTATRLPLSPTLTVAESSAPIKQRAAVLPWVVGIVAAIVIVALALKRRS